MSQCDNGMLHSAEKKQLYNIIYHVKHKNQLVFLTIFTIEFRMLLCETAMHLSALDMEAKMMEKYKSKLAGNYTPKVNELYNIYVGRMKVHQ